MNNEIILQQCTCLRSLADIDDCASVVTSAMPTLSLVQSIYLETYIFLTEITAATNNNKRLKLTFLLEGWVTEIQTTVFHSCGHGLVLMSWHVKCYWTQVNKKDTIMAYCPVKEALVIMVLFFFSFFFGGGQ